jgi:tetratricopeptide (TPR) repeat protein
MPDELDDSLTLDLDADEPLELDLSMDDIPAPAPARPPVAPPPPQYLMSAVEMVAADLADQGDDLDFITEHLTEAEVFAKYGLAEKAAEHLRTILERAPKNLTAHDRLFRILLEEGEADAARTSAQAYVAILEEKGDTATIAAVRQEFLARGQTFEPAAARATLVKRPTFERPLPPPVAAPEPEITLDDFNPGGTEMTLDLDSIETEMEFDLEEPEPEPIALTPEITPEPTPEPLELVEPEPDITFDDEEISFGAEEPAIAWPEPESEPVPTPLPEPIEEMTFGEIEPELEPEMLSEPELASEPDLVAAAEPFFGVESIADVIAAEELPAEDLSAEELGEIDFYIQQELFDEARRKVDDLLVRFAGNPELESRRDRIEASSIASSAAAAAATPPPVPAPAPAPTPFSPAALSRAEIESELLSAIPDDDDDLGIVMPTPPPPAAAAPAPQSTFSANTVQEDNLFADEEDFFDLAAELESELAEDEEPISLSEEEQSLEEIFKEFKKGVEQQLDSEDYDTHYNLGIAYKEMGLIDEAIGEFQLASKDPKRAVECASMLGLCFLEKGMPQLAIKWYRKGLEMPEITEEEHVGLLYDLGAAYQEVGDTENAQKSFMEVYGMNSNYRDTVPRIKALEDAKK